MSDFGNLDRDLARLKRDIRKELPLIVEAVGAELLAETRKEIVRQQLVDTRDMLNSFSLGNSFNVFEKSNDGMRVEAGTTNSYAEFVNDGHWTVNGSRTSNRRTSSTRQSTSRSVTCPLASIND